MQEYRTDESKGQVVQRCQGDDLRNEQERVETLNTEILWCWIGGARPGHG